MKKLVSLFIVMFLFISVSSMNIQQRAENIMFLNNQIEETLLSIEILKNQAEFIRLFNISSKQAQTEEELEFSYKIHEIIQETKEEVENSLSFLSKIIEKRNHSSNRSFNILKILNDICDSYPEITMLFIEHKDELIINSYNRVYLTKVLNSIRFDETDYEERFLNISLSEYMADFIKNRWEFAYEEYIKTNNKKALEKRKNTITSTIYWYDRLINFSISGLNKKFSEGLKEYGRKNYNKAIQYFIQSKNENVDLFLKHGGFNWTGSSYHNLQKINESLENYLNSAIKESKLHRINTFYNIVYLSRAELEQNIPNLKKTLTLFVKIRDEAPSDEEQMKAELEIIRHYKQMGDSSVIIEDKELNYVTAINLATQYYNKWVIT
ncbi:MAG: hypothetical protein WC337_04365, partial [Candidatus Muiribacteriota bacterium]